MAGPIPREEALRKGGADLRFTLSRNDVDDDLQAAFFTNGITTIQKFSSFFRSEDDLIEVMRDSFATDAANGLEARAQLASVICAWRETQTKQKRQAEVEAEMDTREWTKPIPTGDYINLRNAFTRVLGKIEDKVIPSKEYMEKKLQELENGEFRAELLSEVVSKDEVDPDIMVLIFDSKGALSVKKGSTTVALPTGPEQLRRRLSVMLHCILMLALKHTNREEIQDMSRDTMERYKDYILGDYVWGLSSTDLQGNQIQTPPWSLVLSYEHAVRKRAYSLMVSDHLKLGAALEQAWGILLHHWHYTANVQTLPHLGATGTQRGKASPTRAQAAKENPKEREQGQPPMGQRFASGSTRENAVIRNANLLICATGVSKRDTMP